MAEREVTDFMPKLRRGTASTDPEYIKQGRDWALLLSVKVLATTVDAGSTPTSTLRKGLVLAKISATGKYDVYSNLATNGLERAKCILDQEMSMLDENGVAEDKWVTVVIPSSILVDQTQLIGLDIAARADLAPISYVDAY